MPLMMLTGLIFAVAMLVMAGYNFLSIRGLTNTFLWHLLQYALIGLVLVAGWLAPHMALTWHTFGEYAGIIGLGAAVYVAALHWLLANK